MSSPPEDTSLKFFAARTHTRTLAFGDLKYLWVVYALHIIRSTYISERSTGFGKCNDCAAEHFYTPKTSLGNLDCESWMTAHTVLSEEICSGLHAVSSRSNKFAPEVLE